VSRGLFVTGTDTNVGKTVVSAAIVALRRAHGPVRYWKPVQTGVEQEPSTSLAAGDDTAEVARLAACGPDEIMDAGVRLPRPVSPHLAAQLAGVAISIESITAMRGAIAGAGATESFWVIEGAGGVLVPLNDRQLMIDLMVQLALPVVVVARTAVGTINHTLLTLEALRQRGLDVASVVMSGEPDDAARQAIAQHGRVRVEALPRLTPLTPQALASWAASSGTSWPI
jgi:dethiobiotin synthetase